MPLKKLGRPPYLLPDEIQDDELLEIIEKPWIVEASKTKWGRERGKAVVKIIRSNLIRTMSFNATSWDRLIDAFGDDPGMWLNKKVQAKKETRNISGVDKQVIFLTPYKEPQQQLNPTPQPSAPQPSVEDALTQQIRKMTPEQRQHLLEILSTEETT